MIVPTGHDRYTIEYMHEFSPLEDQDWPDEYEVDYESLANPKSEEPFNRESFELLKEAAGLIAPGIWSFAYAKSWT